jgi:hypothetical protein
LAGPQGPTGGQGPKGDTGATGPQGAPGLLGLADIPAQNICVDKSGGMHWGTCEALNLKGANFQIFAKN